MFPLVYKLHKDFYPDQNHDVKSSRLEIDERIKILRDVIIYIGTEELDIKDLKNIDIEALEIPALCPAIGGPRDYRSMIISNIYLRTDLLFSFIDFELKENEGINHQLAELCKQFFSEKEKAKKAIRFILAHALVHAESEDALKPVISEEAASITAGALISTGLLIGGAGATAVITGGLTTAMVAMHAMIFFKAIVLNYLSPDFSYESLQQKTMAINEDYFEGAKYFRKKCKKIGLTSL